MPPAWPLACVRLLGLVVAGQLHASAGLAQDDPDIPTVAYPTLPVTGTSAGDFAPAGWVVEAQAEGDLNKDGLADVAFVLRDTSAANVIDNAEGLGVPSLDTNPRILCIGFKDAAAGSYRLVLRNHTLIPRTESATVDDAFDKDGGLTVARGAVSIELNFFASAGSWETSDTKLTFRYGHGHFRLIGLERSTAQRNSGEMTRLSVNYSTRRAEIYTGTIESDAEKLKVLWLPSRPLPTIEEVGNGIEFEPIDRVR